MPVSIDKKLVPVEGLQTLYDVQMPIGLKYRQLIVTGPPGAGKSHLIKQLHGWPNEGYIDLTRNDWWRDQTLTFRPREVHLGLPFAGLTEALTVFDDEWLEQPKAPKLEKRRIQIPPAGPGLFQADWRSRYIIEFLLPPAETILTFRENRGADSYHPVDEILTLEIIQRQVAVYAETALHLHRQGLQVYVRETLSDPPMRILDDGEARPPDWAVKAPETIKGMDGLLRSLKAMLGRDDTNWVVPGEEALELHGESRVAYDGNSLLLDLRGKVLTLAPETPYGVRRKRNQKNWLVFDPATAAEGLYPFLRIKVDESVLIGRANEEYDAVLNFPKKVALRHVNIRNANGDLIITVLDEEAPTHLSALPHDEDKVAIVGRRRLRGRWRAIPLDRLDALRRIREIYGGPLEILPEGEALSLIRNVNARLREETGRERAPDGAPGALIELPDRRATVIVGDLHAQVDNLLKILSENHVLAALEKGELNLVILGDAVHSEVMGEMESMDDSVLMMDLLFRLKVRFPDQFFYLRGNHDSFDDEISKNGIPQGLLMRRRLLELRDAEYVAEMERFYDLLAYVARSDDVVACHGGPPARKMSRGQIVDLKSHGKRAREILTSRLKQPNKPGGYSKGDVKKFRKSLDLAKRTPLVVGHTPLSSHGTLWLDVGGIKGHHIVYSANPKGPGVFLNEGERLVPLEYPAEPLLDLINGLE